MINIAYAAYKLQVQFPGVTELQVDATPGIAQYIGGVYAFALLIAGITAFGVIIFAAIEFVMSAGKPSLRQDAIDRITQAVFGLILLFAAYLILNTINPELVQIGAREQRLQKLLPPLSEQQQTQQQQAQPTTASGQIRQTQTPQEETRPTTAVQTTPAGASCSFGTPTVFKDKTYIYTAGGKFYCDQPSCLKDNPFVNRCGEQVSGVFANCLSC